MYITRTQCCAVQEIAHLGDHQTAQQAMTTFCQRLWPNEYAFSTLKSKPYGFYVFTGVTRIAKSRFPDGEYGPNFMAFIKKHKLGKVTASVTAANRVNHPDHFVKVYVWAPSECGLRAWWTENRPKEVV